MSNYPGSFSLTESRFGLFGCRFNQTGRDSAYNPRALSVRSTALIKVISKSSTILDRVWAFHVRDSTPPSLYPGSKFVS